VQEAVLLLRYCRQAGAKSPGRTARFSAPRHSAHCGGTWLSDSGTKPAREPLDKQDRDCCDLLFSAHRGPQIKIQMQFVTSIHQRSEGRPPTHNTHNYIQVKPDTFRSSLDETRLLASSCLSVRLSAVLLLDGL